MNGLQTLPIRSSWILKLSLFATGLSGIVAEYILSTLASYFLGDSIIQWTLIVSLMLFAMGFGAYQSQFIEKNLLEKFILIEFMLSILVAFSALGAYLVSAFTIYKGFIIYLWSVGIGVLIGLEIPLITRLNAQYEPLRLNISSVMESDYYGSLVGGLFFAFVGLPILGLTYTPFVLGYINFLIATFLFFRWKNRITLPQQWRIQGMLALTLLILTSGIIFAKPILFFGEQHRYQDTIIYEAQSKYQKIVITQWKNEHWLFINGSQQLSTIDEALYHEPLVHPILHLSMKPQHILVMGGGDGCAVREILKYPQIQQITVVDLDPLMTNLAKKHPVLVTLNDSAFFHPKVNIINQDAFQFLRENRQYFDVMIIDLPDPKTIELNRLYSKEFYQLCYQYLRPHGWLVTQSGSPYYATKAFECIQLTLQAAGFQTLPLHNQIPTLGEWGWTIGVKKKEKIDLKKQFRNLRFEGIKTKWLNTEAMYLMTSFGKKSFFLTQKIEINTIQNPVLYKYYLQGNWDLY